MAASSIVEKIRVNNPKVIEEYVAAMDAAALQTLWISLSMMTLAMGCLDGIGAKVVTSIYLRMTNVKENNNLRDLYYRDIMLGEQSEELYEPTNNTEIALAFHEAGEFSGS